MKHLKYAAITLSIHGSLEIVGGLMALLPVSKTKDYIFAMPFLRDNLIMIGVIGIIFGLLRIAAAIGLWRNLLWSWWLAMIICIITLILMIFMVPSGIGDGILAGLATVWLLIARYGKLKIINR